MREYGDVDKRFEKHLKAADERYAAWLRRGGVEPNDILIRENRDNALNEARESFVQESVEIRDHNIGVILKDHNKRLNTIKCEGAHLRVWTCPPIALFFGLLAWYSFSRTGAEGMMMGVIYGIGALAFLGMLVLGAIFDRPKE
jgi:hypothetical protein